jgi:hypothetical protein
MDHKLAPLRKASRGVGGVRLRHVRNILKKRQRLKRLLGTFLCSRRNRSNKGSPVANQRIAGSGFSVFERQSNTAGIYQQSAVM